MHTIRLGEPWQGELISSADGLSSWTRYHRRFHRPSGLDDRQAVMLVLHASLSTQATIRVCSLQLNARPLRFDERVDPATRTTQLFVRIDSLLEPYNLVEIVCEIDDPCLSLGSSVKQCQAATGNHGTQHKLPTSLTQWGAVQLEIHN